MKRKLLKITSIFTLLFVIIVTLNACDDDGAPDVPFVPGDDGMAQLTYPDYAETPDDKNSWEYIDDKEDLTIKWYVDVSSWVIPTGKDEVSKKIKEVTGIDVKFETPVADDGTKLSTMIAGNQLPDVISIPTSSTRIISSLAQQGYVYDINTLAQKWAPSLYEHLPKDVWDWWAFGNGKTYGIPNHYYSYEDIPQGEQLQPNGGMMVREDIFDAWQAYCKNNLADNDGYVSYTSIKGLQKKVEWQGYITTPEGFKAAAKWALENYGKKTGKGNLTSGLLLAQFTNTGSQSLQWLSQFFAIPFEDKDGNYQYQFTQESYKDMLMYLNDLYNEGIISDANFTQDYDGIGGVIAEGAAFATLVTPQNYQMHFVTADEANHGYVSMYITNTDGDAPVLSDIRGYGYLMNMITTSCKRPDLVIKLFDFLTSDEGQLLVTLGIEGETWNYTDSTKKEVEFTPKYLVEKAEGTATKYGLMQFDLLLNYQFYDNMQPKTNNGKTKAELLRTNLKRPLTIYAYDFNVVSLIIDATNENFNKYINNLAKIESLLGKQVPKVIKAKDNAAALKVYNQIVSTMDAYGLDLIISMNTEAYNANKAKLGLTNGWPAYQEGYVNPLDRTQPNGDLTKYRSY